MDCYIWPVPHIAPFRGFLYDRELVPRLEDVVAPPYDVIDPAERTALLGRHPWNAAHIEVGDADEVGDCYTAACRRFQAWTARGILRRDPEPRLYLYRQGYHDSDGRPRQTSGVIAAVGLEEPGHGILPHEETMPKPLGDRLDLLRACRVNVSPIYVLSTATGFSELLEPEGPPRAAVTDSDGVHHRLYDIMLGGRIAALCEAVGSAPLVIADGHHRYQTALAYQREEGGEMPGADSIMAFVVELSTEQLTVRAIHRLLPRVVDLPNGDIVKGHLDAAATERGTVVVATAPRQGIAIDPPPPGTSASAHLHDSVLTALGVDPAELSYEADPARVVTALETGATTAFYLPPVSVEAIAEVARMGGRFPQKTTYFAPKPLTGLVYRSLVES